MMLRVGDLLAELHLIRVGAEVVLVDAAQHRHVLTVDLHRVAGLEFQEPS